MKLPEFKETVPLMLEIFNEPFGITRQYQVTRLYKISRINKVAISGDGADENFAGYKDSKLFYLKSKLPSLNLSNLKLLSIFYFS